MWTDILTAFVFVIFDHFQRLAVLYRQESWKISAQRQSQTQNDICAAESNGYAQWWPHDDEEWMSDSITI